MVAEAPTIFKLTHYRSEGGVSKSMKLILRLAVALVSCAVAWMVTGWSSRLTLSGPLPSGGYEATPATLLVVPAVLVVTFSASMIGGNIALNRYFRSRGLR
jgi:hypothetical protein